MPIKRVQFPDGSIKRIEVPEGATNEQILSFVQSQYKAPAQKADFSGVTATVKSTADRVKDASPSLFRADSDFGDKSGLGGLTMLSAAARDMFGTREGVAEYLAKEAGGRVRQTETGDPVVQLPSGESYRVNDDGIDTTDVANVAGNVAAFLTPASWASKLGQARNVGLAGRSVLQGGTAAATDAGLQATVNNGKIDGGRTALAGLGGAGGELFGTALSAGASRLSQLYRSVGGGNARAAQQVAADAGMTPTAEQARRLAGSMEEVSAGADPRAILGREEFGLTYTQGQRLPEGPRRFAQLSREELLRQSPGGGEVLRTAERGNLEALGTSLSDMGERLGSRAGATPAELAQGAASRVSQQADDLNRQVGEAYEKAGGAGAVVYPTAVASLPSRVQSVLANEAVSNGLTPAARTAIRELERRVGGMTSQKSSAGMFSGGVNLRQIEGMRQFLNKAFDGATNRADRRAMTLIKGEFDSWMDDAFDNALMSGDKSALTAMKEARALRTEYARRFEGGRDSDRFIAGLLDGSRTPEELVNLALGAGQVSKSGGARFIDRLRQAAAGDPEVVGNLRGAHFLRLTRGNNGEPLAMGQIVRNIRSTDYNNASIVKALYSPAEWAEVRRLASALEPLLAKGDMARSSGSGERLARMMFQRVGGGLPVIGELVQAVGSVRNTMQAQKALSQPLRLPTVAAPGTQPLGAATFQEGGR